MAYRDYTIQAGDSLQLLAQRFLEDANRWSEIALLNDLSYPYISEEPLEDCVTPGDTIKLPIIPSPDDLNPTERIRNEIQEDDLGIDLWLSSDKENLSYGGQGDLEVSPEGDLMLVSGIRSLSQDLSHRLLTPLGALPYHPEYGSEFPKIIGNKKDRDWINKATIELSRTFLSDERVTDVQYIEIREIREGVYIQCMIYTDIAEIPFSINV